MPHTLFTLEVDRDPLHICSCKCSVFGADETLTPNCRVGSDDFDHREVLVSGEVKLWQRLKIQIFSFNHPISPAYKAYMSGYEHLSGSSIHFCILKKWMFVLNINPGPMIVQGMYSKLPWSPFCVLQPVASWLQCLVWPPSVCDSPVINHQHQQLVIILMDQMQSCQLNVNSVSRQKCRCCIWF